MVRSKIQFTHYLFNMIFVSNLRGVGISVLLNVLNIVKTVEFYVGKASNHREIGNYIIIFHTLYDGAGKCFPLCR